MLNQFLARFDGEAVMVNPNMSGRIGGLLSALASHEAAKSLFSGGDDDSDFWSSSSWARPYVVSGGILQIPVKGVLLKDFPYQFSNLATGYEYIRAAFDRGLADDNVDGIAFIFDTPGGMVAGNFDLVDHIYESRGIKPVAGFVDEGAYSGGYSLVSAVDPGSINVARTGGVGSIGVVMMHVDQSKLVEGMGLKVTFIHAGKYKVDGNSYEPLSEDAKSRFQEEIDDSYNIFVATVARNRGLSESEVRATEALCFTAPQAVSKGLADTIGPLNGALAAFAANMLNTEGFSMSNVTPKTEANAVENARQEGFNAGKIEGATEAKAQGASTEKARIVAILASDEAKARPKAALAAALKTNMSVEDAAAFLGDLPEESAAAAAPTPKGKTEASNEFKAAMNSADHPEVGAPVDKTEANAPGNRAKAAAEAAGRAKAVK